MRETDTAIEQWMHATGDTIPIPIVMGGHGRMTACGAWCSRRGDTSTYCVLMWSAWCCSRAWCMTDVVSVPCARGDRNGE